MSKLFVLDSDPLFSYQYVSCLTASVSHVESNIESIEKTLMGMFRVSSKASDEKALVSILIMLKSLRGIFFESQELRRRLSSLSSFLSR
ncbi:hypothetical protein O4444_05010 [Xylella fastidiosa subsp. pauca]|uniref:hypothetical protein n=1 Tax=Xylella fastidiosa TaxID=2371 RepID=UPI00249F435B|nr:hypothetical protein [Xylella fastidiosa]WGZ32956.1 hypothetical protein O4444_05010 [Xylella fastidiosa subsp. pauca]